MHKYLVLAEEYYQDHLFQDIGPKLIVLVFEYLKARNVAKELMPTDSPSQSNSNIPVSEYDEPDQNASVSLQVIFEVAKKYSEENYFILSQLCRNKQYFKSNI